eukprot:scaffold76740_cov28-Tisochrysis_lutea.AAC.2
MQGATWASNSTSSMSDALSRTREAALAIAANEPGKGSTPISDKVRINAKARPTRVAPHNASTICKPIWRTSSLDMGSEPPASREVVRRESSPQDSSADGFVRLAARISRAIAASSSFGGL